MGKRIFRKELFLKYNYEAEVPEEEIQMACRAWANKCDGLDTDAVRRVIFRGLRNNAKFKLPDEWFEIVEE
jgi:hypothetical protein